MPTRACRLIPYLLGRFLSPKLCRVAASEAEAEVEIEIEVEVETKVKRV